VTFMSRPGTWVPLRSPAEPVTRDGARDAAHREVSKGMYHSDDPSLVQRAVDKVVGWVARLFDAAAGVAPGGAVGLVVLLLAAAALVSLLLWRGGPLRRGARGAALDGGEAAVLGPDDHRRLADDYARAGRHAEAVRERMRAIVRELEARGVLEPRPGATAQEVAADAGAALPHVAADLALAARIFDEVWYGGRRATPDSDAALRDVDRRLRDSTLRVTDGLVRR
jgi:hypothetical protein